MQGEGWKRVRGFHPHCRWRPKGGLMRTRYELEFDMPTLRTITHNMYTCNIETLSDC
jgi:hypothetical protein